ncbi:hypothetical protein [Deinococcus cellulosilyticus]|uniref:Uridine kinase n=1 Tax=Deinococcus cellulosilyticus (strain DSM 18568 / NBRC 106333 / KACC 11606 / 5516J-15) TaxID=1223518 RepID=A0A511MVN9_DEIC1|nr:hypothetical protein [Deinococcus cellulosilyticus]GEM44645.1 hypothetical protein DC3_02800 [Deinococcus cellulosilyticus NBRC 106333 = KACC 11606]
MKPSETRIYLIGGPSGTGKSSLSYPLAKHLQLSVFEVDDIQAVLEKMLTPEQAPLLHFWRTHWEEFSQWPESQRVEHFVRVAREYFSPAIEAVIAHHLEAGTSIVIEGDFLLPELAVKAEFDGVPALGRVRALFVTEEEDQIRMNYQQREGRDQHGRARASWLFGEWLKTECERLSLKTLPVRPWGSALERASALFEL